MVIELSGPGRVRRFFSFPDPVNEKAARAVAAGVVVMCVALLATQWFWLLVPLTYGFLARVLTGPTMSPLGRLATHLVAPRLGAPKDVPGPPKRFAQGMGLAMALAACVLHWAFGLDLAALVVVTLITIAAALESILALCLGCKIFGLLMRTGLVPASVCEACQDVSLRRPA